MHIAERIAKRINCFLHRSVCKHGAAPRKTAVKCSSHHRQGISLSAYLKTRIDFEKTCGTDRFCKCVPKNPSRKTWIFSFVPQAQHHLRATHATSLERQLNIIAAPCGTNERGCTVGTNDVLRNDVGLRPMMLRFAQTDTPSA